MIIFDLDGTLADCEHRRHFVDHLRDHPEYYRNPCECCRNGSHHKIDPQYHKVTHKVWKPDWKEFYEACDQDKPIESVIHILEYIGEGKEYGTDTPWVDYSGIEIWSGRCESVRKKTEIWLSKHIRHFHVGAPILRMRPIGDKTPDDVLKENWLNEVVRENRTVEFVFDDSETCCDMWKSRGIFVFDCNQSGEEF